MTHLDSSALATYNSLVDPHLQCYFSGERIRSHLKHAGLIGRRGEIVSDGEYRMKLVRREHKKHVRQMLAENIVHRAIDMERARQSELRRQLDIVAKATLVNSVKESRRRFGYSGSFDLDGQSPNGSLPQHRPRSASQHQGLKIFNEELADRPRVHSAHIHRQKYSSRSPLRRSQNFNRPKSTTVQRSSSSQRPRSPTKLVEPLCQVKMIYYGPHTKIDYDHTLFEPVDEIMVMQQHCGGENLIVYKNRLEPGKEFEFTSRRHAEFPLGLSLYINGLIDSRISTCCEYRHRHGVRLGGERGHFAIISVEGSKPCLKCRFSKQSQMKEYGEEDEDNGKPITISIPVSDQPRNKQTPVKIPVRPRSDSNEKYSDDFQEPADKSKHDQTRSKSPTETSSTSTIGSEEKSLKKTWQIIFHTSNIPMGSFSPPKKPSSTAVLKFSFISLDGDDETEEYLIQMKDFPQGFKSSRQDSFRTELRDIGKPKQIRLIMEVDGQENNEDVKWHLDHIEVIDPKTQIHYRFPCNQWIRPSEEKLFNNSDSIRKGSTSTSSSKSSIAKKASPKSKSSSRSSSSSYDTPKRFELIKKPISTDTRRISTDVESTDSNKVHYRVIIYPAKETDGEFDASNTSRIYLRLNNQAKDSILYRKGTRTCPSFQSGIEQTFEMNLRQNENEKPTKLTFGYYNNDISAGKWKLQKIVLINTKTGEQTVFPCQRALERNDFNLRAEQILHAQTQQSTDDQQSTPRNPSPPMKHTRSSDEESHPKPKVTHHRSDSDEGSHPKPKVTHHRSDSDDDTPPAKPSHIRRSSDESSEKDKKTSSGSRPKTRRGLEDNAEQSNPKNGIQTNTDVWRPSSGLKKDSVDPLVGLEDLQNPTARSNEQKSSSTPSDTTEGHFKNWYRNNDDDEDDEQ